MNDMRLTDLAVQPRDEVIAQVMAFLLERGYVITAPDGRHILPSATSDASGAGPIQSFRPERGAQ